MTQKLHQGISAHPNLGSIINDGGRLRDRWIDGLSTPEANGKANNHGLSGLAVGRISAPFFTLRHPNQPHKHETLRCLKQVAIAFFHDDSTILASGLSCW